MNRQRGFTLYIILAALVAFGGLSAYAWWEHRGRVAIEAEYATFRADVKARGEAAEREALRINADNLKRKNDADATNTKLRADVAALAKRLRDQRSVSGFLPKSADPASNPDRITFQRADLERTLQRLDAGVSGIVAEGDGAVTDLATARSWAAGR